MWTLTMFAAVGLFIFGVGFDLLAFYQALTGTLAWTLPSLFLSGIAFSGALFGGDYAVKHWSR